MGCREVNKRWWIRSTFIIARVLSEKALLKLSGPGSGAPLLFPNWQWIEQSVADVTAPSLLGTCFNGRYVGGNSVLYRFYYRGRPLCSTAGVCRVKVRGFCTNRPRGSCRFSVSCRLLASCLCTWLRKLGSTENVPGGAVLNTGIYRSCLNVSALDSCWCTSFLWKSSLQKWE